MNFILAIMGALTSAKRGFLLGNMYRRLKQLRNARNIYGVCNKVLTARLMLPELILTASNSRVAGEVDKEGFVITVKLNHMEKSAHGEIQLESNRLT